jgi:hypothetical protein
MCVPDLGPEAPLDQVGERRVLRDGLAVTSLQSIASAFVPLREHIGVVIVGKAAISRLNWISYQHF